MNREGADPREINKAANDFQKYLLSLMEKNWNEQKCKEGILKAWAIGPLTNQDNGIKNTIL